MNHQSIKGLLFAAILIFASHASAKIAPIEFASEDGAKITVSPDNQETFKLGNHSCKLNAKDSGGIESASVFCKSGKAFQSVSLIVCSSTFPNPALSSMKFSLFSEQGKVTDYQVGRQCIDDESKWSPAVRKHKELLKKAASGD